MTYTAGSLWGMKLSESIMIVFMEVSINTNTSRGANTGVFKLTYNSHGLRFSAPYDFICSMNGDAVLRLCGYIDHNGSRYVSTPIAWQANTEFRLTGVAFANIV